MSCALCKKGRAKPNPSTYTIVPSLPLSHHFTIKSPGLGGPSISLDTHMDTFWKPVPFSWLLKKEITQGPYTELLTARRSSTKRAGEPEGVIQRLRRPQGELALVLEPADRREVYAHWAKL